MCYAVVCQHVTSRYGCVLCTHTVPGHNMLSLSRLKCKLPDDGRRPKHVGAIFNIGFNVNFRVF
jgi:hypothetical protein